MLINPIRRPDVQVTVPERCFAELLAHLDADGGGLDAVLRTARNHPDAGLSQSLRTVLRSPPIDLPRVQGMLSSAQDDLLSALGRSHRLIDGERQSTDIDNAMRWHAARLTDFANAIERIAI